MNARESRGEALAQGALVAATLALALTLLWPAPAADAPIPGQGALSAAAQAFARVTYDDGYYYLEIARHVAQGQGSSFDGLHPTNGYHPLWMLMLVPIAGGAQEVGLRLVLAGALQLLLSAAGVLAAYRSARVCVGVPAATLAALCWLQYAFSYRATLSGLEFALQALLLFSVARLQARAWLAGRLSPAQALSLGLLLAALFLARLETVVLGLLVCAAWAARLRATPQRASALLRLCLPLGVTLVACGLLGTWLFGQALPVSAHMKREWSQALLLADPILARHGRLAAELADALWPVFHQKRSLWLYLALGLLGPALLLALPRTRAALRGLMPLVLFGWLQYVAAVALYHGGYAFQPWYYLAPAWLACLLVAHAAQQVAEHWPRAGRLGTYAACAALLVFSLSTAARARSDRLAAGEPLHAAANWAREHVPPGERIGAWNAGGTAFFSGRTVVSLDGLVNSWPYALHERFALCEYWRQNDVRYLVDAFESADRFGYLHQPLPCLEGREPIWIGPRFPNSPRWRVEAYLLPR